jgi:hypothetical protein
LIKLYNEEWRERNTLLTMRYYRLDDMQDIMVQDHSHWIQYKFGKLYKQNWFLNPDTTVSDMKKQMAFDDD